MGGLGTEGRAKKRKDVLATKKPRAPVAYVGYSQNREGEMSKQEPASGVRPTTSFQAEVGFIEGAQKISDPPPVEHEAAPKNKSQSSSDKRIERESAATKSDRWADK